MFKKIAMILMLVLLPLTAYAGGVFQRETGTKENWMYDDSTSIISLRDYNNFGVRFKITENDTSKTDTITITLQGSHDKANWETVYTFDEYATDTSTLYKFFPLDSLMTYPFDRYVRLYIASTSLIATADTGTLEVLEATGNGLILDWTNQNKTSPGADTTRWSVINETSLDTTDYDYLSQPAIENIRPTGDGTPADWNLSTGSDHYTLIDESTLDTADYVFVIGADTFDVFTMGNRTSAATAFDSIVVTINARKTDTATVNLAKIRVGVCLEDTSRCSWSDSLTVAKTDVVLSHAFATNPNGAAWDNNTVDSVMGAIRSTRVDGGALKVNQFYIVLYPSQLSANLLFVTCADHTKRETDIDSIRMTVRGGWDTDTCALKFGTAFDTVTITRQWSDSTLMQAADTTTYTQVFITNPYGTAWTQPQVDSLQMCFKPVWMKSGAKIKVAQAYLTVYYNKGLFEPPIQWRTDWILKE